MWHLAVLALAAVAPFAALTAYLASEYLRDETAEATEGVERLAQSTAIHAERMMDRNRLMLAALATRPGVGALDPARCDPLLTELLRLHPEFANIFTLDASGRRICSAAPLLPAAPSVVDPRYFLDAVRAGKTFTVGQPAKGFMTGKWVISAVQPLLDRDGRVTGVVGIAMDLLDLAGLIDEKAPPARDAIVVVVNSRGLVLTRNPDAADWAGRDLSASPMVRVALEGKSRSARAKDSLGMERLWAFAPVEGTDWIVLAGIPTDLAMAPAFHAMTWIAALSAAGAAFVVVLCNALARPIARPIEAIAAAARRMSSHDSMEHLTPSGPTEIAALAEDLNRMLDRRMSSDRELREHEKELSLVTDNYPGLVAHLDGDLRYLYAGPGFRMIYARAPEELVGRHVREVVGPATFEKLEPQFARALGGERVMFQNEVRTAAGAPLTLLVTMVPDLDTAGRKQGIFVFATDISARLHAEAELHDERARLEGIVASAMDAIVTVDSAHRITRFNPAAEKMFGARAADMIGRDLDVLIPPALRDGHSGHVDRFGMTGAANRAIGMIHGLRADGEQFPLEASISKVEVGGEKFFTAILRDVTERKRAEDAILELNADLERRVAERTAELEALNRELETFDYSISHDLRAPLNRIRGFSQALLDGFASQLDTQARGFLQRIQASGESMDQLVTDLLSLSTLSRGELHRAEVDLSAIARDILETLRKTDADRQVEVAVASDLRVHADPGLMRVVLENLLGNAWKFTSRRADARIEFGRDLEDGAPRYFVRDNGAGFDAAFAGRLFEPFRRLHSQSEYQGTGIGLATVQRIVRRHGGRVWAEGAVGKGATIYFTLSS